MKPKIGYPTSLPFVDLKAIVPKNLLMIHAHVGCVHHRVLLYMQKDV